MKKGIVFLVLGAALVGGAYFTASSGSGSPAAIMKMAGDGASEKDMLSAVEKSSRYTLTADDVIKLRGAGVPNKVVIAMLQKGASNGSQTAATAPVANNK